MRSKKNISFSGGLSIGISGELRAYWKAYLEFGGGVSCNELFQPTICLCRGVFLISKSQAIAMNETKSYILQNPGMRFKFNQINFQ